MGGKLAPKHIVQSTDVRLLRTDHALIGALTARLKNIVFVVKKWNASFTWDSPELNLIGLLLFFL